MKQLLLLLLLVMGCSSKAEPQNASKDKDAAVAAERAKLSAEDQALVSAQEWCVVSTRQRLGGMGPPIKLTIEGQPVFICCDSCATKAQADPAKTLGVLASHKAKAKP